METQYNKIKSLEEISDYANKHIGDGNYKINFTLPFSIQFSDIENNPISDVTEEAQAWAAATRPPELHINHGEYIKDGLEHIISELKQKKTSNRALFSLISQMDISKSNDSPIPSFMVMQCNIEDNHLFCTAYFRAIEVSKFLRINLEEIRLKICEIYKEIPEFDDINLAIFAFRAYSNNNLNPLRVPKLDRLQQIDIYLMLKDEPKELSELIQEKSQDSTVIDTQSLENILYSITKLQSQHNEGAMRSAQVKAKRAVELAKMLREQRKKNSHHEQIERLNNEFRRMMNELAEEIRSWQQH